MKKTYIQTLFIAFLVFGIKTINAQCTAGFIYSIGSGGSVTFTSTSTGTSSLTNYYWQFGDGNFFSVQNNVNASHTFPYNGVYSTTLTIYDTLSMCTNATALTFTITNAPCTGVASFTSSQGPSGLVNFYSTASSAAPNATYYWDFGDGNNTNSGTTPSTAHTYTAAGNYSVTMIVTDALSICSYTVVQTTSVSVIPCSLIANFTYTNGASGTVNFSSTSTGTSATTQYYWNYGDSNYGNGVTSSHTYSVNNIYTVTLNVKDSVMFACTSSITQTINVNTIPCVPNSNFTIAKDSSIAYTWKAFPAYPPNIIAASWYWGDGNTSVGLYPSHTYSAAGFYSICLSVTVSCTSGPLSSTTCVNSNIYRMITGYETASMVYINVINSATGINEPKNTDWISNLYPNPNNGNFTIDISNIDTSLKDLELNLYNVIGEKVYTLRLNPINGKIKSDLSLENMPNGTYFVKIPGQNKTNKIIIMR
jgi:PKD repeat protein